MYINILRAIAATSSFVSTLPPENAYQPAGAGDLRSPCPALNTLANHGFIPRNGQNISTAQFLGPLTQVYHLSSDLANSLVAPAIALVGNTTTGTLDLDALALHNVIEHDASLVHDDAAPGEKFAPIPVDQTLVDEIVNTYPNGLTTNDFAAIRVEREAKLVTPLGSSQVPVALGESALTLLVMASGDVVPAQTLKQWYGGETFPDTYVVPVNEITLDMLSTTSTQIAVAMASIRTSASATASPSLTSAPAQT